MIINVLLFGFKRYQVSGLFFRRPKPPKELQGAVDAKTYSDHRLPNTGAKQKLPPKALFAQPLPLVGTLKFRTIRFHVKLLS
jgi:hypothetical protein